MIPLTDHNEISLKSSVSPYVNLCVSERKCRSKVEDGNGKIETNCISWILSLIEKNYISFWEVIFFCLMDGLV